MRLRNEPLRVARRLTSNMTRSDHSFQGATLYFFSLLAISAVLWWHPLLRTFSLALSDEAYTHILLILPLGSTIVYLERSLVPLLRPSGQGWGAVGLGAALLVRGIVQWGWPGIEADVQLTLTVFALVVWWIGSVAFCFGVPTFQALIFPLSFLFWMVPFPDAVLDEVVEALQHQSAAAALILFRMAGVPVTQDGVMLSIPNLDIEVARECSSIRSSMLLVIITMILAHLFLRSWWRKVLFIAAAIPMAAIKNGFRIFTITELGTRVDPGFFDGNLHHRGGILFLGFALVMMSGLLLGLRRGDTIGQKNSNVLAMK